MIIEQVSVAPSFVNEDIDYTEKFVSLIKSSPDYLKWFEEPDKIIEFVEEFTASRDGEGMLRFVGKTDENEIAYVAVSGMSMSAPEIQITVAKEYRGHGYGKEMLQQAINWLFENTDKEMFLYRIAADNEISERLIRSIGGIFREPKYELERATVKTYEVRKNNWPGRK